MPPLVQAEGGKEKGRTGNTGGKGLVKDSAHCLRLKSGRKCFLRAGLPHSVSPFACNVPDTLAAVLVNNAAHSPIPCPQPCIPDPALKCAPFAKTEIILIWESDDQNPGLSLALSSWIVTFSIGLRLLVSA